MSAHSLETIIFKLTFKQKKFVYDIARLEYKIWQAITKLEIVNTLIEEEEKTMASLTAAINAAGEGPVSQKISLWKLKSEIKLFKLQLRKNKIDITRLIANQSKLEQTKQVNIVKQLRMI